jgi:acyl-CoA thioesterase I
MNKVEVKGQMRNDLELLTRRLAKHESMRWVFTGDSIAHGALHTMGWRDYTELFAERVRWEMSRLRDCVIKTATSGWKITDVETELEACALRYEPHAMSIAVGTNDCYLGADAVAAFTAAYKRVIARIRAESDAAVIIHTPPPVLPLDELRSPHLPAYVQAVRDVAASTGAILVDHHAHWTAAAVERGALAYWLSDAIHPNECGHRAMAHLLLHTLGIADMTSNVGRLFVP